VFFAKKNTNIFRKPNKKLAYRPSQKGFLNSTKGYLKNSRFLSSDLSKKTLVCYPKKLALWHLGMIKGGLVIT